MKIDQIEADRLNGRILISTRVCKMKYYWWGIYKHPGTSH